MRKKSSKIILINDSKTEQIMLSSTFIKLTMIASWLLIIKSALGQNFSQFQLKSAINQSELLDRVMKLDSKLPKMSVENILKEANRFGNLSSTPDTCNPDATRNRKLTSASYCFDSSDSGKINGNVEWMPQGITTVADARTDQEWNAVQPILISWYDKKPDKPTDTDADKIKGTRITFFDSNTAKYQHVLLVYPLINSAGNASYMSLRTTQTENYDSLHAGGIAWYGTYLYVADTAKGFRVFDMNYIFDLSEADNGDTNDKYRIGLENGKYYAHGYRYVMPQVAAWSSVIARDPNKTCTADAGSPTFSFTAIDRSTSAHLITGEFCADDIANGDINKSGRVFRWPIDSNTGQPKLTDDIWQANAIYRLPISNIQGAVSYKNIWYLSRSQGLSNGILYVTKPISSNNGTLEIDTAHYAAVGPEDLSHWPKTDGSPGGLWTVTEHAGRRLLYVCNIGNLNNNTELHRICGPNPNAYPGFLPGGD